MGEKATVYVFRDARFAKSDTVVSAAPASLVAAVYGGGGLQGEGGVETVFGGSAFFQNDESGAAFIAVWGARNASRFRSRLRQSRIALDIVNVPPPGKLKWWNAHRNKADAAEVR